MLISQLAKIFSRAAVVVPWYRNRGGGTEGGCPSKIFVERPLPPKTEPRNLRLAQQWAGLFLLPKNNGLPAQRCFQHPALPAVISNKQPTRPPPAKTRHLGPSLLTPTHLHCLSTSTGHLPCGPHPSSNHQIIVTISPKPYSTFQYPAKVSARVSKLCKSTGNPHTTAARSMYSSFSRGEIIYPGFRSCRQAQQF